MVNSEVRKNQKIDILGSLGVRGDEVLTHTDRRKEQQCEMALLLHWEQDKGAACGSYREDANSARANSVMVTVPCSRSLLHPAA